VGEARKASRNIKERPFSKTPYETVYSVIKIINSTSYIFVTGFCIHQNTQRDPVRSIDPRELPIRSYVDDMRFTRAKEGHVKHNINVRGMVSVLVMGLGLLGCNHRDHDKQRGRSDQPAVSQPITVSEIPGTPVATVEQENGYGFMLTTQTFGDCAELQRTVYEQLLAKQQSDKLQSEYWAKNRTMQYDSPVADMGGATNSASTALPTAAASDSAGGAAEKSITNTQEQGVDEQDFVKVSKSHLFVLKGRQIEVLKRNTLEPMGVLKLEAEYGSENSDLQMYATADRLLIIGRIYEDVKREGGDMPEIMPVPAAMASSMAPAIYPGSYTYRKEVGVKVVVFDAANETALPQQLATQTFKGQYVDTRLTGSRLYIVIRDALEVAPVTGPEAKIAENPVTVVEDRISDLRCSNISKPAIRDMDFRLLKVASLPLATGKDPLIKAVLGGGDQIYMTETSLYVMKNGISWQPFVAPETGAENPLRFHHDSMVINKFSLFDEGKVEHTAAGLVRGRANNQFHFQEVEGGKGLIVATTMNYGLGFEQKDLPGKIVGEGRNHLFALKHEADKLMIVGGVYRYGKPGEDIRAVRFQNQYAYVVTFKKTDPLYAFDLKSPFEPRLAGELQIPGFSMYLHPIAADRLIGVGYDADDQGDFAWYQGIQVSLFDVASPEKMVRLDNKVHGGRGSFSDVTSDHHAFFFDAGMKLAALPLVELTGKEQQIGSNYAPTLSFTGAVLYAVEADKLVEKGRLTHKDIIPANCLASSSYGAWWSSKNVSMDINRIINLDGRLITVSRFGLKEHESQGAFKDLKTVRFQAAGSSDCQ
jgi:uncharacterized secreted protein with C-terminal beta-propeller domain